MIAAAFRTIQIPLIHMVESDDLYLEAQEDVFWFGLLRDLDWPADQDPSPAPEAKPRETKGSTANSTTKKKPKRKSHPKTTKSCRCKD